MLCLVLEQFLAYDQMMALTFCDSYACIQHMAILMYLNKTQVLAALYFSVHFYSCRGFIRVIVLYSKPALRKILSYIIQQDVCTCIGGWSRIKLFWINTRMSNHISSPQLKFFGCCFLKSNPGLKFFFFLHYVSGWGVIKY